MNFQNEQSERIAKAIMIKGFVLAKQGTSPTNEGTASLTEARK